MKNVMTIRIDQETRQRLDRMAQATARTRSFLVADAIQEYLSLNEWQVEAIQEGVRQADAGRLVSHGEVRKHWEARLADPMD